MALKVFPLTEGDEKRMPVFLTQDGAALAWTPTSVKLRFSRGGSFVAERDAEAGASAAEWYYDWTAADYTTFSGGHLYDVRFVVTKPGSVEPSGPETVPPRDALKVEIAKAI